MKKKRYNIVVHQLACMQVDLDRLEEVSTGTAEAIEKLNEKLDHVISLLKK